MTETAKAKYRVRDGYWHGAHKQHGPGTVLELTAAEAAGFLDKLELVSAVPAQLVKDEADLPFAEPVSRRRRPRSEA